MPYGSYSTLLLDQKDAVLKITVNRAEVLNAQSRIMREEFDDAPWQSPPRTTPSAW